MTNENGAKYSFNLDENGNPQLDRLYLKARPITNLQIEFYGTTGLVSFAAYGRPVTDEETRQIPAPRLLLTSDSDTPVPTELSKVSFSEVDLV
jgi:hypothetical protein